MYPQIKISLQSLNSSPEPLSGSAVEPIPIPQQSIFAHLIKRVHVKDEKVSVGRCYFAYDAVLKRSQPRHGV